MPLSTKAVEGIKGTLDHFVNDGSPGLAFHAIDKSGKTLVEHASGTLGLDSSEPIDTQSTIFWIASCTKLVTAIALLQLVEQGKVPLDDAEFVKKTVPELSEKKVYADGVNGVEQEKSVTMRMLLSHTAGFGYAFADPRLQADGIEGRSGNKRDILDSKMVNQPGSMWEYGINMDWAGIVLERVTGQTLGEYFQEHIFTPVGIAAEGASMFPSKEAQKNLAHMHQRDTDGTLKKREHLYDGPLSCAKENQKDFLQSGGAGLWSRPSEYIKVLAALLNDGTNPQTQTRILKKESMSHLQTLRWSIKPRICILSLATLLKVGALAASSLSSLARLVVEQTRCGGWVCVIVSGGLIERRGLRECSHRKCCPMEIPKSFLRGSWRRRAFMTRWNNDSPQV
jgi:CubicO group peptidase (beta-lactamase class C family)